MYCANCGDPITAGTKFCGTCGAPVPIQPAATPAAPPSPPEMSLPTRPASGSTQSSAPFAPAEPVAEPLQPIAGRAASTPLAGRPIGQRSETPRPVARMQPARSNKLLALYGSLTAIVALVLIFYFATRSANSAPPVPEVPTPGPTLNIAQGIGTVVPDEGNAHVSQRTPITYTTYPPSSGTHYPDTAPYQFFDKEVPEGNFVHSMEHGGIVLYYRPDVSDDVKQQLKDLYTKLPIDKYNMVKIVIVPYTKGMTTPLAIAAWDHLLLMKEYNFNEIQAFYRSWVDKGPESVP